MKKAPLHLIFLALVMLGTNVYGEMEQPQEEIAIPSAMAPAPQPQREMAPKPINRAPFHSFTGRIVKNKVRLRSQPSLDGTVIKELSRGDMLVVVGETEEFYAVQPPVGTKAYIFRTFVLDDTVEGSKVNIRLEPDLESPIVGQLNAGDKVHGVISPTNNKWLEIAPPNTMRYYIAKDFVEKIGGPDMLVKLEKRKSDANSMLESALQHSQEEMAKSYDQINLDAVLKNINKVVTQYPDFPEFAGKAKEAIKAAQDTYLEKKIAYLEAQTRNAAETLQAKNQQLANDMKAQEERMKEMEEKFEKQKAQPAPAAVSTDSNELTAKMSQWASAEEVHYQEWLKDHAGASQDDFYKDLEQTVLILKGIIEPYNKLVKNKPGDYVLVSRGNNLPVAFLYSTKINLQNKIGQEHTIKVVTRPNNHFAFPAYFVLSVE